MPTKKTRETLSEEQARSSGLLKALRVLDTLAELDGGGGVTLQQIAEHAGESKSTVHRWLQALRDYGLVDQSKTNERYRLGLKILELGSRLLSHLDLRSEAAPALHDLMVRSGETVHLGVYDRGEVVYLEKIDGPGGITMRSKIGMRMPSYCTAMGRALLAHLPAAEVQSVIDRGLVARTPSTIVDPVVLLQHLEEVRLRGYAVDAEENEADIVCVGAPVFDHAGRPVAAISVSGLSTRLTGERLTELALMVRMASEAISARLGYRPVGMPGPVTSAAGPGRLVPSVQ